MKSIVLNRLLLVGIIVGWGRRTFGSCVLNYLWPRKTKTKTSATHETILSGVQETSALKTARREQMTKDERPQLALNRVFRKGEIHLILISFDFFLRKRSFQSGKCNLYSNVMQIWYYIWQKQTAVINYILCLICINVDVVFLAAPLSKKLWTFPNYYLHFIFN